MAAGVQKLQASLLHLVTGVTLCCAFALYIGSACCTSSAVMCFYGDTVCHTKDV